MRKKIFFGFSAGIGPFIRCVPIMDLLRSKGYEVAYNAIDNVTGKMDFLGYELVKIPWVTGVNKNLLPPMSPHWYSAADYWGALGYRDGNWVKRLWETYSQNVKTFQPDLIVGDFGIEAKITAQLLKIPFVSIIQSCYHPCVKKGRLRFWEEPPKDKIDTTDIVNRILEKMKLKTITHFEDLFDGDITIIPSFEEFDELEVVPDNTHYVGPILWKGNFNQNQTQAISNKQEGQTIFVYTGRLKDFVGEGGKFILMQTIEHLMDIGIRVIISNGGLDLIPQDLYSNIFQSKKIQIVDWIPISEAYENSSLVIHHGGHGSCMATFKYGTPSLVIPTQSEREYNARAIAQLGAGEIILPENFTQHVFIETVKKILKQVKYRKTAIKWRKEIEIRNYGGEHKVVEYIERLL